MANREDLQRSMVKSFNNKLLRWPSFSIFTQNLIFGGKTRYLRSLCDDERDMKEKYVLWREIEIEIEIDNDRDN